MATEGSPCPTNLVIPPSEEDLFKFVDGSIENGRQLIADLEGMGGGRRQAVLKGKGENNSLPGVENQPGHDTIGNHIDVAMQNALNLREAMLRLLRRHNENPPEPQLSPNLEHQKEMLLQRVGSTAPPQLTPTEQKLNRPSKACISEELRRRVDQLNDITRRCLDLIAQMDGPSHNPSHSPELKVIFETPTESVSPFPTESQAEALGDGQAIPPTKEALNPQVVEETPPKQGEIPPVTEEVPTTPQTLSENEPTSKSVEADPNMHDQNPIEEELGKQEPPVSTQPTNGETPAEDEGTLEKGEMVPVDSKIALIEGDVAVAENETAPSEGVENPIEGELSSGDGESASSAEHETGSLKNEEDLVEGSFPPIENEASPKRDGTAPANNEGVLAGSEGTLDESQVGPQGEQYGPNILSLVEGEATKTSTEAFLVSDSTVAEVTVELEGVPEVRQVAEVEEQIAGTGESVPKENEQLVEVQPVNPTGDAVSQAGRVFAVSQEGTAFSVFQEVKTPEHPKETAAPTDITGIDETERAITSPSDSEAATQESDGSIMDAPVRLTVLATAGVMGAIYGYKAIRSLISGESPLVPSPETLTKVFVEPPKLSSDPCSFFIRNLR